MILEIVFSESVAFSFAAINDDQDAAADANIVYEEEDIVEECSDYTIISNGDGRQEKH